MKLLFDRNLSHRLVGELAAEFPDSRHVRDFGMTEAEDWEIWAHAASQGFVIVSKDSDFYQRALIQGFPPKVIWLRIGNSTTETNCAHARNRLQSIHTSEVDSDVSVLILT